MSAGELAGLLEESAEDLFEHAPVAYLSTLVDGTLVRVNETLLTWTGYARDDLVSRRRLHDLLAPGARIYYETHYAPLLQMQGEVREVAVELVRADGSRLPVLMNSTLVRDGEGRPRIVRTTCVDASERRRYERELLRARADAEMRARATHALDHLHDGVLLVDPGGRIELLNPAAERILGVAADDVVGRPAIDAIEGWHETLGRGAGVVPRRHRGGEQWLDVVPVEAGDATVYTLRDITSERKLEELRNELIAVVSHELRTPLTGAYGAAQTLLVRGESLAPQQRQTLLEMVVEQTRRLAAIVDQILLASRIDTGNVDADVQVFDAALACDGVVQSVAGHDRHRVIVDVESGVDVCGDLDRLRQVIANLVDNALKYSDGPVRIELETENAVARFTVADEGPGIPAAEHERIFEKFYRLDPDQTRGVGGTGLGLYIARELVSRMGGRVGLLPRSRGTTVFVELPRA
jgi:PAS domain S-box-containing protein